MQIPPNLTTASSNTGPIFIVGCPRSGTTLVQQLLNAHPEVAIAPETHFIRRFWLRRQSYGDLSLDANYAQVLDDICTIPEFCEMGIDPGRFRRYAWRIDRSYAALFALLLDQFRERCGARLVGEKTPNHLLYIETLRSFFRSARFVHIIRDPRAVVNSWRTVPWSTGNLIGDVAVWRRYADAASRCGSQLFTMHYELLIRDPLASVKRLCTFLGIVFHDEMMSFHQLNRHLINTSREPWKTNAINRLSSEPLNQWRFELSSSMIAQIEAVSRRQMRSFGYEVESAPLRLAYWCATLPVLRAAKSATSRARKLCRWS